MAKVKKCYMCKKILKGGEKILVKTRITGCYIKKTAMESIVVMCPNCAAVEFRRNAEIKQRRLKNVSN